MNKFSQYYFSRFFLTSILFLLFIGFTSSCSDKSDEPNFQEDIKVRFENSEYNINVNQSMTLKPIIESGDINVNVFKWVSSDPSIVSVNNGVVTGLSIGIAKISIIYKENEFASCDIYVNPINPERFDIEKECLEMYSGESYQLSYSIYPENSTYNIVSWSSSNNDVAIVDNGKIIAVSIGECEITANIIDTDLIKKCKVSVLPRMVEEINCPETYSILKGNTTRIEYTILPESADNKDVSFESLDTEIATVTDDGLITGVNLGSTEIVIKSIDGACEKRCVINIEDISKFINIKTSVGSEGSTSSGFYSYIKLNLKTNVDVPIYLTSVILTDENNYIQFGETPNKNITEYVQKYRTYYHGNTLSNTFKADGWKFFIEYEWDGKIFEVEHVHYYTPYY